MSNGDTIAIIVNWKETMISWFEFDLSEIGVIPSPTQIVHATDLWTNEPAKWSVESKF